MAFQPIIDLSANAIWGYEALVRGRDGSGAAGVLAAVSDENRYRFDQACRVTAIELAGAGLPSGSTSKLSINFMPNAVYEPTACIRASLAAAAKARFDPGRLMFEFTENERIEDTAHVGNIIDTYRRIGFTTALDDFGAGYAGLGLLARFHPDLIKIDMDLIRGVHSSPARQAIIRGISRSPAHWALPCSPKGSKNGPRSPRCMTPGSTCSRATTSPAPNWSTSTAPPSYRRCASPLEKQRARQSRAPMTT